MLQPALELSSRGVLTTIKALFPPVPRFLAQQAPTSRRICWPASAGMLLGSGGARLVITW